MLSPFLFTSGLYKLIITYHCNNQYISHQPNGQNNTKCNRNQEKGQPIQGYNARKVNYSYVYSAYRLKPVISGRNL